MTELCTALVFSFCFCFLFSLEYKLYLDVALIKLHVLFGNSSRLFDPKPSSVPEKAHGLCLNP